MPNWCNGYLIVRGDKEDLKRFDEHFKRPYESYNGYSFSKPVEKGEPTEQEIFSRTSKEEVVDYRVSKITNLIDKDVYNINIITSILKRVHRYSFNNFIPLTKDNWLNGWYDWCCRNWGTKWDGQIELIQGLEEDENSLHYDITTAWAPPNSVIVAMYNEFPMLDFKFTYEEYGCQILGLITIDAYSGEALVQTPESCEMKFGEFRVKVLEQGDVYANLCEDCGEWLEKEYDQCYMCGSENLKERQVAN